MKIFSIVGKVKKFIKLAFVGSNCLVSMKNICTYRSALRLRHVGKIFEDWHPQNRIFILTDLAHSHPNRREMMIKLEAEMLRRETGYYHHFPAIPTQREPWHPFTIPIIHIEAGLRSYNRAMRRGDQSYSGRSCSGISLLCLHKRR